MFILFYFVLVPFLLVLFVIALVANNRWFIGLSGLLLGGAAATAAILPSHVMGLVQWRTQTIHVRAACDTAARLLEAGKINDVVAVLRAVSSSPDDYRYCGVELSDQLVDRAIKLGIQP